MYKPSGKNDANGEYLGGYEEIVVITDEEAGVLSKDGDGDSDGSNDEHRHNVDDFEDKNNWFISVAL